MPKPNMAPALDVAHFMQMALAEARKSPPKPTNFCVGACLVADEKVLATGFTLECAGNTHAEQSCFIKLAAEYRCRWEELGAHLPEHCVLYTTMEPCNKRSAGNMTCVDRILHLRGMDGKPAIGRVYVGVIEPETFVGTNEGSGQRRLRAAGIEVVAVPGLEDEILQVSTAGHVQDAQPNE